MPTLEMQLTHRGGADYLARFEYAAPGAGPTTHEAVVRLDPVALNRCAADPVAYGRALAAALFPDGPLRNTWEVARPAAGGQLLVRLSLPEGDTPLRRVRWEALSDPASGAALATDQGVWFARALTSPDPRAARLRTKPALKVLVAVAAPAGLDNLLVGGRAFTAEDQFDPAVELPAIRNALADVSRSVTTLPSAAHGRATLANIVDHLRQGYDLFYLIAHGVLDGDVPKILLEDDAGNGAEVDGRALANEIGQLWHRPALVVLSSCQSAGPDRPFRPPAAADDEVDTALGAELGRAGVSAVVSMLGNVYQKTARTFVKKLFEAVALDGQIERAIGEARHAVRGEPDAWAPVLGTRQEGARLWTEAAPVVSFDGWKALIGDLQKGKCVPVLGSGLLEQLIGETRTIAEDWVKADLVPLTPDRRLDLPQVAQYLSVTVSPAHVRTRYMEVLANAVNGKWPAATDDPEDPDPARALSDRLARATTDIRRTTPAEGHALLARLNCPLYITTNADGLLADALRAAGKAPVEQLCNWLTPEPSPPGFPPDGATKPTAAAPLVCQLFGHLSDPRSVVLTEDDYFKFLVGMSRVRANPPPSFVQQIMTRSTLLFLGFRIDDWDFRAFHQFLLSGQATQNRKEFGLRDVAVQIDPKEEGAPNADKAREYLKSLFGKADINIYWGSVGEFLGELYDQWPAQPTP